MLLRGADVGLNPVPTDLEAVNMVSMANAACGSPVLAQAISMVLAAEASRDGYFVHPSLAGGRTPSSSAWPTTWR